MRTAFVQTLVNIAESDDRIWLLCGDLGYSVLEPFAARFADRFVNVGVAEQNMTGIAAGLALSGKVVFTYSIANFPIMRCLEQIRNDVCYHDLNVKIVAVGGGLAYGAQGYTHHGLEDLAVMRAMPNMAVVAPSDPLEAQLATRALVERQGPCYLRLGKAGEPNIHQAGISLKIGQVIPVRPGTDALLVSIGGMLQNALEAAEIAANCGVSVAVWSSPTLKPLDTHAIVAAAGQYPLIMTVEEANIGGGLGGAVAEVIASIPIPRARLMRVGVPEDVILSVAYSQSTARGQIGLAAQQLCDRIVAAVQELRAVIKPK
jgi:transketolase